MIIVNLKGGLGNQMFQYALGYCLSQKKKVPLSLDLRLMNEHKIKPSPRNVPRDFDLDVFDIKKKEPGFLDLVKTFQFFSNYRLRKYICILFDKFNLFTLYEKNRLFNDRVFKNKFRNLYLDGLWQSENYFKEYREDILRLYNFDKIKEDKKNIEFLSKINFSKSICLNVRRTDFINNPEHNVVNINYYKNSLNKIGDKLGNDFSVYIFSDDLDWCKKNFDFINKKHFVEHNFAGYKFYNYLYLMTCFKNFIIPNSSFAWWGAWLSNHENKIIMAPKKWSGLVDEKFIEIVPSNWIRISY